MGVVDDPVEDGIRQGGVFEVIVPEIDWDLGDQDTGALLPAVVKDLKQMTDLIGLERVPEPVIDDQQRDLG